ncbi:MAG: prepilin-type N-terminal cleavage/methylation domain-containing protein [Nitrospinales bacterium]|jgi:prepilin-type N-terminal cleavage/methylation domain-containing protein
MKKSFKFYSKTFSKKNRESGFTLMEIIMAIVIIGIAVPSIMIPFQGLSDTKGPEYIVQASFLAQERMEQLANEDRTSILTSCPNGSSASVSDGPGSAYTLACTSVQVNATNPDTSTTSTFARKVTLTITRADMDDLTFNQLFAVE